MLWYLTILSAISTVSAAVILIFLLTKKEHLESLKFFILGMILVVVDFIIEYRGTSTGLWTYHQSIFFVEGLIPIELLFLFFSTGVLAGFFYTRMNKVNIPVRVNTILYFIILITALHHVREVYMTGSSGLLYLSIAIGLWGFYNISEKNKESALVLAFIAAVIDFITEKIVIGGGGYSYQHGFEISVPITYALMTLGLLAVLEKMDKLDVVLEHPFIKKILKAVGVKRDKYKDKFNGLKERVKDKMEEKGAI